MEETYERSIFEEEARMVYGGFWERFGALILDGLILLPLTVLNYFNTSLWKSVPLLIAVGIVSLVYKPLLEFLYSATPGKKALSLMVVNTNYDKINLMDALLRNIFGIIGGLGSMIVGVYTLNNNLYMGRMQAGADMTEVMKGAMTAGLYGFSIGLIYIADAICLIANNKKQSLHDLIAKTYVIRK